MEPAKNILQPQMWGLGWSSSEGSLSKSRSIIYTRQASELSWDARLACLQLIHPELQVLLVRRGKEPQKGMLTFPGGSLELGERMADCAIRETLEETGLRLKNEGKQSELR